MERYGRSSRDNNSNKVREPWRSCNHCCFGGGEPLPSSLMSGFSWPPRSYTCSFCKREFRSAQALGGHMNVHRRDRARLRQSPPWDPPLCKPNPNPNPSSGPVSNLNISPPSCTTETKLSPVTYTIFPSLLSPLTRFPLLSSSSSSSSPTFSAGPFLSRGELKATKAVKALFEVEDQLQGFMEEEKEREVVRLDLEIGVSGSLEEDLDLELRLGYT